MQQLLGPFWFHETGPNEVTVYERIGRRQVPIRVETEGWPDRLTAEAKHELSQALAGVYQGVKEREPLDSKLGKLKESLKAFPNFESMGSEEQEALVKYLTGAETPVRDTVIDTEPAGSHIGNLGESTFEEAVNREVEKRLRDFTARLQELESKAIIPASAPPPGEKDQASGQE